MGAAQAAMTYPIGTHKVPMTSLRTKRLIGERMTADHARLLEQLHAVPEVMNHVGGLRTPAETARWLDTQLAHWATYGFGQWVLRSSTHKVGEPIGRGGLRMIDGCVGEELVEIGYVLNQAAWGQGYATEAAAAFVEIAESHYGLDELGAITARGNDASTRVLEKNGFVFERWVEHHTGPHKFLRRARQKKC